MVSSGRAVSVLVVDRRAPIPGASSTALAARFVPSLEAALAHARYGDPTAIFVHVSDSTDERRAAVTAAAELGRRLGSAPVLYGPAPPVRELAVLCELGVLARFLPEDALADRAMPLAGALASESLLRDRLHEALRSLRPLRAPRWNGCALWPASAELETRIIAVALQQARTVPRAAMLLSTSADRLEVRARKLGIRLRDLPRSPLRSRRDRILIIGEDGVAGTISKALGQADLGLACLPPGILHAGAESDAGTIAAVVHVASIAAAIDAWALRWVRPGVPQVLHGEPDTAVTAVLTKLALPPPISTAALTPRLPVLPLLAELGQASCEANRLCIAADGLGLCACPPAPVDVQDVVDSFESSLAVDALAQQGSARRAAARLRISPGALLERLRRAGLFTNTP